MNRLRAARQPVSLYMPLILHIGPMLEMAVIFLGVGLDTMFGHNVSKQLPLRNPKNTFFGIQLDVEPSEVRECCGQVCDQVASLSCFDHYVINIDGDCRFWPLGLIRLIEQGRFGWRSIAACTFGRWHQRSSNRMAWLCNSMNHTR